MQTAPPTNVWVQLAAPLATIVTTVITIGVTAFRDFDSITRKNKLFELEKKRLEYWKLHTELRSAQALPEGLTDEIALSAERVGRLAEEQKHYGRRLFGEAIVVFGFLGSLTAVAQKVTTLWPALPGEWKTGMAVITASLTFLLLSYAVDFARDLSALAKKQMAKKHVHKPKRARRDAAGS